MARCCVDCLARYDLCECARPFLGAALNALPARILDYLDVDGSWLTTRALADRFDADHESVRRACSRLRDRGLVEGRLIGSGPSRYIEWRFVAWELTA